MFRPGIERVVYTCHGERMDYWCCLYAHCINTELLRWEDPTDQLQGLDYAPFPRAQHTDPEANLNQASQDQDRSDPGGAAASTPYGPVGA